MPGRTLPGGWEPSSRDGRQIPKCTWDTWEAELRLDTGDSGRQLGPSSLHRMSNSKRGGCWGEGGSPGGRMLPSHLHLRRLEWEDPRTSPSSIKDWLASHREWIEPWESPGAPKKSCTLYAILERAVVILGLTCHSIRWFLA